MTDMNRAEAQEFLKSQTWYHPEGTTYYHLIRVEREGLVKKLKDAFNVLAMGYDGDFGGIYDKERDDFTNINVDAFQFHRAHINVEDLKTTTERPELSSITPPPKKKRKLKEEVAAT